MGGLHIKMPRLFFVIIHALAVFVMAHLQDDG